MAKKAMIGLAAMGIALTIACASALGESKSTSSGGRSISAEEAAALIPSMDAALRAADAAEDQITESNPAEKEETPRASSSVSAQAAALQLRADPGQLEGGVWKVQASGEDSAFRLSWQGDGEEFKIALYDEKGALISSGQTSYREWTLYARDYLSQGVCTAEVLSSSGASGKLCFRVILSDWNEDQSAAGAIEGGEASRGQPSSGEPQAASGLAGRSSAGESTAQIRQEQQEEDAASAAGAPSETKKNKGSGRSSTKASSKKGSKKPAKSSKKETAAAAADVGQLPEEPVTALTLNGEALEITLNGGEGLFTAALSETTLCLTAQEEGEEWQLSGQALQALMDAGITSVQMSLNGEVYRAALSRGEEETEEDAESIRIIWTLNEKGLSFALENQAVCWSAVAEEETP